MQNRILARTCALTGTLFLATSLALAHDDVVYPDGGESFQAGEIVTVEWTVTEEHTLVDWDVFYSTTGNQGPWIPIAIGVAAGDPTVGSVHTLAWLVPDLPTAAASIMVRMNGPQALWEDTSAADFTIEPGIGVEGCAGQALNSSGASARAFAIGSASVADNGLTITIGSLPTQQNGYLLNSMSTGFVANAGGSDGNLCLSGSIGRHLSQVANSGPGGFAAIPIDLTTLPRPMGTANAMAGETWHFQFWTRDANPGPTSNFSSTVAVTLL